MREMGYIGQEDYDEARLAPITATYHGSKILINAPYVAEMVRSTLVSQYGKMRRIQKAFGFIQP